MLRVSLLLLLGAAALTGGSSPPSSASNSNSKQLQLQQAYRSGDPRRCLDEARTNGANLQTFEVLPGYGWDNLRNVDEGQIVAFNYSQCRTTKDGRFLLPDSVSAVPVKASRVETFAEFIDHWKDWTSTTSRSINVDAGLSLTKFSISGKFSADFEDIKSKQIGDKSVTTRAQLRYIRYGVQLQPDTPLHPVFKRRVLSIAAAQELGQKDQARYLSQLLVRDFGTHIVTKADAGAALEQVDQIRQEWVSTKKEQKSDILASASATLFSVFHMSASYETKTNKTFLDTYRSQRTSSRIQTKGGPLFRPANFTPNMWADEVDRDLVAMDRSGDPLYYVLTGATLPELPASTLTEVYERVKEAVETYYSYNRIPGCLDPTSPSFSPAANTDDGSCKPAPSNMTFGGVFQTCTMSQGSNNGNLCGGLTQVNPLTGGFSCPANYQAVKLHTGSTSSSRTEHVCKRILFWHRCHDDYYQSAASYDMYWCVATGSVPPHSGYLFGGLYTSRIDNPVTRASSCPPSFFPLNIGMNADLHVCLSDDFEFGEAYSVPFAGFISCAAGNPLAVAGDNSNKNLVKSEAPGSRSAMKLKSFFKEQADEWPMRCPDGFSRHLATVDQGCQINYCVRTGSLAGPVLPPIKRPPFISVPPLPAPPSDNMIIFDPETYTWKRNKEAQMMMLSAAATAEDTINHTGSADDDSTMSPGAAAGIAVGTCLGGVALVGVAVMVVRNRRRKTRAGYRQLQDPLLDPQDRYGSVVSSADTGASPSTRIEESLQ